jgi:hypothetical protein
VGVYLATTEYGTNYLLGRISRSGLSAGESFTDTQSFRVPDKISPGQYFVTVFIDDSFQVSESNENNNIGSSNPYKVKVESSIREAQIVSLSTERETYCMDEIVKILFTIKNTGNVRLHLRVVLEIKDPSNKTIYDTHQVGQDKEYWLDPGQQISDSFSWKIPRTAPPGVYKVLMSVRDWDDWNMIYDYRWGGKPGPEFKVYALRVRLDSITLNGQTLSTSNPELRVAPGSRITGTVTFTVENVQPGSWITPVIWVTSWERGTVADGRVRVVSNSISSTQQFTVKIDVTAPGEPGTYYIGFFAGWMYSPDEVASNDHPPKYGDGDDIWDMKQSDWESILRDGRAPEDAIYGWPGRAIRVVVEKPSPQPQATNTGSNGILKFMVINYSYMFSPYKMLGIMIPPNIEVLNVTAKILWPETYHGYRFNFYKVIWFRCYRVLYLHIFPGGTSIWQVNITYRETYAEVIPVEYDEIADPVADKLLDNIHHEWKAYPVRHNLKVNVSANYKYIIITPEDWIDVVRPLVEWKTKKGIPTFAASLQWINDNYPGNNLAQKIKEFLSDAYFAWHSHYVLLLGSTDLIPTWYRDLGGILWPSDWYYVCLDGEFDYLPEMIIGRLPATSKEMAKNMISKIIEYESSVPSGDWVRKILIIGGFDNEESAVELSKRIPKGYIPLKLLHGYNLTTNNVISLINQGVAMVYVFSHGNAGGFEGLDLTSVDLLSNKPVFPFFVVFACSTAPYHHANEQYIALKLLSSPQGGAIGYIGAPYPIFVVKGACLEGPLSPPFEETCSRPGLAFFYDSLTSLWGANISTALVYLGDPEMSLWTAVPPKSILINVPTKVWIGENITVTVIDSDTNQPLQGVIVRIFTNSSWTELITNQMGQVTLKAPPSPSIINLRIYALFRNKPTELNTTVYVELPTTTVTTTYTTTQTVVVPTTVTTTYITTTTIPTTYTTTIRIYEATTVVKHETVTTTSTTTTSITIEKTATLTVTTPTTVYERVVDWSTTIPIAVILLVVGIAIGYLIKRR